MFRRARSHRHGQGPGAIRPPSLARPIPDPDMADIREFRQRRGDSPEEQPPRHARDVRRKLLGRMLRQRQAERDARTGGVRKDLLQDALFRIADVTLSSADLSDLYSAIHAIVGELMDATNFYIALYDEESGTLSFPWFVDQFDQKPETRRPGKTLTGYVLR